MDAAVLADLKRALADVVRPAPGANLSAALDAIERAQAALGRDVDPRLGHYLTGRSYVKALNFLEGREAENLKGACG